jgi:hypothetical protein
MFVQSSIEEFIERERPMAPSCKDEALASEATEIQRSDRCSPDLTRAEQYLGLWPDRAHWLCETLRGVIAYRVGVR